MKASTMHLIRGVFIYVSVMSSSHEILGQSQIPVPGQSSDAKTADCMYWRALVDKSLPKPDGNEFIDDSNSDTVIEAIKCLLALKGNKNPARFSGAIRTDVSQIFDEATADVAALYYVSYLYTGRFDHARAVALRDPDSGRFNTERAINLAFRAYKKWFRRVERIGLQEARRLRLNPLDDSNTSWY